MLENIAEKHFLLLVIAGITYGKVRKNKREDYSQIAVVDKRIQRNVSRFPRFFPYNQNWYLPLKVLFMEKIHSLSNMVQNHYTSAHKLRKGKKQ